VDVLLHDRRVASGGFRGQITPLDKKCFNFLGFLRAKIQKNIPLVKFLATPLLHDIKIYNIT